MFGCGKREKFGEVHDEQKWDYVNLDDFKSKSCWTGFGYAYLLIMLLVSISIYVVDSFVAVNLLAFNRWAGQIEPAIPFTISRWIFAGCIILSFVLLIERWIRAIRVMKQGGVAKSYLDPLAVRLQSIRWTQAGRGYRRFLVFAELTKSRKGADYVALFSYFSFEAAIRIIFAEGPRVVINGITLYSVTKLNFIPTGDHAAEDGTSPVAQFFINIGAMAEKDKLQATVLFGMLWTCVIWILAAISLAVSVVLYLLFLWHHIPSEAGGLKNYCRIKINKRMERVVKVKVDKALKKENEIRAREEAKAARAGVKKQPTLPDISKGGDGDSMMPLSRTTTLTTLPEYESRPPTAQGGNAPPLPPFPPNNRPGPQRVMTHQSDTSVASFSSNAPLMSSASDMGYTDGSPVPTPGPFGRPPLSNRGMTNTPRPFNNGPPRPGTAQGSAYPLEPLVRPGTGMSNGPRRTSNESVGPYGTDRPMGERLPSWDRNGDLPGRRTPAANPYIPPIMEAQNGRNSPAMGGPPRRFSPPTQPPSRGPMDRSFTPTGGPPPMGPPERSYTPFNGGPPRGAPERSYTPVGGPPLARLPYNAYGANRYGPGPAGGRPPQPGPGYPSDRHPPRRQSSEVRDIIDSY
ncbi:uncharacterized protein HMPREF1541_05687 [Cyphellophora europaea CBS 101466]|uniref:Pheromone-regulated membrane protein 6 n=1 Tax=Cyphellophora europaea (strain CBS 101466) TaxID=1220924 RepID=W2RUM4_CYPE1|nr:uncharacterized protein HMPREF1541_05687 [Cyphellophora europaea CBS 101466]ETN39463.1 hypothetical protein HMPREF1541_05687 [Cyphellophora europaea CBS 101466]